LTDIASGYELSTYDWGNFLHARRLPVVMLYDEDLEAWYVSVGLVDLAGVFTFSTPIDIGVSAKKINGAVHQRVDGIWEFLFTNLSNDHQIVRCANLASTGAGTWS
jgi:hypothetical protein